MPVIFLAEMPSMIGPKHNDGLLGVRTFFESFQDSTEFMVCIRDACQVCLDGLLVMFFFFDDVEILATCFCQLDAFGRDVLQIIWEGLRQDDGVQGVSGEKTLRHIPECSVVLLREIVALSSCLREV